MRRGFAAVVIAWFVSVAACRQQDTRAHLVGVEGVEQIWERPSEVRLRGEGFPVGARGTAHLDGTLFTPEARPEHVQLSFAVRALHGNEALIELRSEQTSQLREGPFEGRLEVEFGGLGAARIVGHVDHVVVRIGEAEQARGAQFAQRQRAHAFQRSLGLASIELTEQGVTVSQLVEQSAAARAGVQVGDVIVRAFGAPVQLPADVWNAPNTRRELEVRRAGEATRRVLQLPQEHVQGSSPWLLIIACVLGTAAGALLAIATRVGAWWAPRQAEYWLKVSCVGSVFMLSIWLLQSAPGQLRDAGYGFVCALSAAALGVCLMRRVRPTLRTERDATLAPLL